MWTTFWDRHSGGGTKEPPYEKIYIEAGKEEAISVFYSRFGHNPNRVSCICCGKDYSIDKNETLEKATEFHRSSRCMSNNEKPEIPLEEYLAHKDVLVIHAKDILPAERNADVPVQGWQWID